MPELSPLFIVYYFIGGVIATFWPLLMLVPILNAIFNRIGKKRRLNDVVISAYTYQCLKMDALKYGKKPKKQLAIMLEEFYKNQPTNYPAPPETETISPGVPEYRNPRD